MLDKKFNLSVWVEHGRGKYMVLPEHRVKEFIRLLKEVKYNVPCYCKDKPYTCSKCRSDKKIDKLAGDKLI